MIYPENFETKIGFTTIREYIKEECVSVLGKKKAESMQFSDAFDFVKQEQLKTTEFKHIILFTSSFPISYYFDVRKYIKKVNFEGAFLSEMEFFELKRSLDTIKSVLHFFKNDDEDKYPVFRKMANEVPFPFFVLDRIMQVLDKSGKIRSNATPELASIRRNIQTKSSGISKTIHAVMAKAQSEGWLDAEANPVIRDGKMLIPIAAAYKRKINGFIYDESDTGRTIFIEPVEIVEVNNELKELEFAERREILKILTRLTDAIRPYFPELEHAYNFLAEVDFTRAKAKFALKIDGIMPKMTAGIKMDFRMARHPLLHIAFAKQGRKVVPSDIKINEDTRIILVSGPNAGGKSVTLKTAGLLQYMLQCGIPIPVNQSSESGIFKNIFIDIGDEQSIENDLSTYSSHLKNMAYFSKFADKDSLILIDEFGTGTEPVLGGAIAEAVLEALNSKNVKGIITTHYSNLKKFAAENEGITNAAMLYDSGSMKPRYEMSIGKPGSSFAFQIARNTGIPHQILQNAESKIDKKQLNFEKLLRETAKEKRRLQRKQQKVRALEKKLEISTEKHDQELEKFINKKRELMAQAKTAADEILSSANRKIESTIFQIKKNNADKEKTKQIRKDLEYFKQQQKEEILKEKEKNNAKIEQIKARRLRKEKKNKESQEKIKVQSEKKQEELPITKGCLVRIKGQDTTGEIIEIKGKKAFVLFGAIKINVDLWKLEHTSTVDAKKHREKNNSRVKIKTVVAQPTFSDFFKELVVRGKRGDESLHIVNRYIDDAMVASASQLKILHGTGSGILRTMIRELLAAHPLVKSFRDERIENGGAGVTLVELDF